MTTIRYVTREELWQEMEAFLEEERMTVEEFRAEGEADTLTDANLRELWLMYRPLLFDGIPTERPSRSRHTEGIENDRRPELDHGSPEHPNQRGSSPLEVESMTPIRYVTRDEFLQRLEHELEDERMTVEEFRAEGEADTLTDGHLRDLWLHYRPILFDGIPTERPSRSHSAEGLENGRRPEQGHMVNQERTGPPGGAPQEVESMATIRYVTRDEFLQRLEHELEDERMTVEEFRAEGEADTLTDANLRELWLHYRPLLFDE